MKRKQKTPPLFEIDSKLYGKKFSDLYKDHLTLEQYLISKDPFKFDLGDPRTLSEINRYLFKDLVGLDITISSDYLIPSASIRIVYAELLMKLINSDNKLVEIGTGATSALAMILAKKYQREIIATEINSSSFKQAKNNISKNNLDKYIILKKSEGQVIESIIPSGKYAGLVCYPPIYPDDPTKLWKIKGWKGKKSELIGGGKDGLDFTRRLIREALNTKGIHFDVITILLMNKKQIDKMINEFPNLSIEYFVIKAGTRKRFGLVIQKEERTIV